MNLFVKTFVAIALTSLVVSCGTDDPAKEHCVVSFGDHFVYSPSSENTDSYSAPFGNVILDFDDDNNIAVVRIDSMIIYGVTTRNIMLSDLTFKADSHGVRSMNVDNLDGKGGIYPIQGIELKYWPGQEANGKKYHAMYLRFTLADGRKMTVLPYTAVGIGTSEITTIETGEKYVSTKTVYNIALDPETKSATLILDHTNFAAGMPEFDNMIFKGDDPAISLSFTDGGYMLKCPRLVPELRGAPFPGFMITSLECESDLTSNEMTVSFYCAGRYDVDAEITALYVEKSEE